MIKPTLNEVLDNAHKMPVHKYMEYCDTIDDIADSSHDIFSKHRSNIIRLERFFWPDWVHQEEFSVLGYQEPGAYIEVYDIFAVNRKSNIAWSIYVTKDYEQTRTKYLLPENKLEPVFDAISRIMDIKRSEDYREQCGVDSDSSDV